MADTLTLFHTFVRVVEAGSFTAVAAELHSSQPTISRQISALEDHLGCALFQRTTRSLSLTDDGRTFYALALRTLESAAEAERAVGRRKGQVSGRLRLASAGVFGRLHVIPRLPAFWERYPDVEIDLVMRDSFTNLIEEGVDLALRVGVVTDDSLVGRTIGLSRRCVVAAPSYLERFGWPQHPDELKAHRCILYSSLATGQRWSFKSDTGPLSVPISGPFRVDNSEGVRAAVLQGIGIGYMPVWHFVEDELVNGALVVLLRDFEPPPLPITAVFPSRRHLSPKVRAAIDFFADEFHLDPHLSAATS